MCSEEAFAPLVVAFPFDDIEEAFTEVNASRFGLQAGVFTNDLAHAWQAFETLEVGGVVINDVPTYRVDHMPYGGVKDSGLGREGIRWAIQDMTEVRLLVLRTRSSRTEWSMPDSCQLSSAVCSCVLRRNRHSDCSSCCMAGRSSSLAFTS